MVNDEVWKYTHRPDARGDRWEVWSNRDRFLCECFRQADAETVVARMNENVKRNLEDVALPILQAMIASDRMFIDLDDDQKWPKETRLRLKKRFSERAIEWANALREAVSEDKQ